MSSHWTSGLKPEDLERMMQAQLREPVWPELGGLMYTRSVTGIATEQLEAGDPVRFECSVDELGPVYSHMEWAIPITVTRRPWYKTTPERLFWRSRASKGAEAVFMREIVERINDAADEMLLRVLGDERS